MPFFPTKRLLAQFTNRAVVYAQHGDPTKVLSVLSYGPLPSPPSNTVNVRFILSPVNPADINVIEGVYPTKPKPDTSLRSSALGSSDQPAYVAGNEGLAEVTEVGNGVSGLEKKDWVIMTKPQLGTWCSSRNVGAHDVLKVPRAPGLSEVHAATMTVNPPTAYNMLQEFVPLKEGDWVMQNGANSAVGQAVIQIAASRGLKTLNFVRPRDDLADLVKQLEALGATKVLTYDALADKSLRKELKTWTGGRDIRLALNCVGGQETTLMTRLLGSDAYLVSYGAMSKQPLSLPTSLFIFKNLTARGFWQSRWYLEKSRDEQRRLMNVLVNLMSQGKLKEPMHEIISISAKESDEEATQKVRDVIAKSYSGRQGKKALLRINVE
ncbi:putative zinc-binding dehydrogenase [Lyophyllum shimeji]|uniref:enoyl-[acyl-carrier-protein] reductase n=1 Tax=Lyophyllum shimeji TaxID=47721 RepID=A0A9P3PSI5_LYOSH|nr:putative zinc-binding dehydrogenase [Lyophyllum shimeji]